MNGCEKERPVLVQAQVPTVNIVLYLYKIQYKYILLERQPTCTVQYPVPGTRTCTSTVTGTCTVQYG